jgi:DNA-binding MarR family transcriptional regulator
MADPITPDEIDSLIHERVRLGIVSALAVTPEMSFTELKEALSVTDGNLSVHARVLEEAGYLRIEKAFVGRRPRTTMSLTRKGRAAFRRYVNQLQRIVSLEDQGEED